METVGAFEAKTHLGELLDRVSNGEEITITKHGRPVARLVPIGPVTGTTDMTGVVRELLDWRERNGPRLGPDLTPAVLIAAGRRY